MEVQHSDKVDNSTPIATLYTVGHSNRTAHEFQELLCACAIECVVDVRAYPASSRYPQFSKQALATALNKIGVTYRWFGNVLGGFR